MANERILLPLLIIILFMGLPQRGYPAFEEKGASSRILGMGGAATGLVNDSSSIYFNPAGVGRVCKLELATTYTTLFGLKELQYNNIAFIHPLGRFGGIGLALEEFGEGLYKERTVFTSYAKRIFRGTYIGITLKHMELSIEGVGRGNDLGFDLGLLQEFSKDVSFGLFLRNMNNPYIGEELPSKVAIGISLRPVERIILSLDYGVIKSPLGVILSSFATGCEFELVRHILLRAGLRGGPKRVSFGFGIYKGWIGFDYAYLTHHALGGTHQLSLILRFKE